MNEILALCLMVYFGVLGFVGIILFNLDSERETNIENLLVRIILWPIYLSIIFVRYILHGALIRILAEIISWFRR